MPALGSYGFNRLDGSPTEGTLRMDLSMETPGSEIRVITDGQGVKYFQVDGEEHVGGSAAKRWSEDGHLLEDYIREAVSREILEQGGTETDVMMFWAGAGWFESGDFRNGRTQ